MISADAIKGLRGRGELAHLQRGIEKESLRVTPRGTLAQTPHPLGLGSALTHPHITTDFSEAQPELITDVHDSAAACIAELDDIHRFVYRHLDDELLWAASMPCALGDDERIPLGRYGQSHIGRMKTIYRRGLGYRYGRVHADDFRHSLQLFGAGHPVADHRQGAGRNPGRRHAHACVL